jgi:hypothetical protein
MNDPSHPLTFTKHHGSHPTLGDNVYDVRQMLLLGWVTE